jgi:hypothetical protein
LSTERYSTLQTVTDCRKKSKPKIGSPDHQFVMQRAKKT